MNVLPAPLAEPLHILEPWPWRSVLVVLVVGGLLLWTLRRWLKNRRNRTDSDAGPLPKVESAFAREVTAIRQRAVESSFYRLGCHELADLLRGVLRRRHGERFAYLTARETATRLVGDGFAGLLVDASAARFGRSIPDKRLLTELCSRALELHVEETG